MACHNSSKKSIRKTLRLNFINKMRVSKIRSFVKKVEDSINLNTKSSDVLSSFSKAQKELMKGASKKVIHPNTVSRKISRLNKKVKSVLGEVK
jgi:small subunit ribosomal protein S20